MILHISYRCDNYLTFAKNKVTYVKNTGVALPNKRNMNSVVEKLAAIENEVAAIQPKMAPLTERIADLDQKVAGFTQQLSGIAEESTAIKHDIELTRNSLARIQTLIGESRTESEQLLAGQEENQQRCETMTAVFGAAFQAFSQFFEAAQRMGLTDPAKTAFLVPSVAPIAPVAPSNTLETGTPMQAETVTEPVLLAPVLVESVPEDAVPEETVPVEPPTPVPDDVVLPVDDPIPPPPPFVAEPAVEIPQVTEPPITEPPPVEALPEETVNERTTTESPLAEPPSITTPVQESIQDISEASPSLPSAEANVDSVDAGSKEPSSWESVPTLPDVASLPEMESAHLDSVDSDRFDTVQSDEIASNLDVPPLNLAVPSLPEVNEPAGTDGTHEHEIDESDEQEIEDLLATMMAPVTT